MNEDTVRILATIAIAAAEIYALNGGDFPVAAWFFDLIARITGYLANILGTISLNARLNYFMAVQA